MDPHTKRTLVAHSADEARELINKWSDMARLEQMTGKRIFDIDSVMITLSYRTCTEHGELVFGVAPQTIHLSMDVLRELIAARAVPVQANLFGAK